MNDQAFSIRVLAQRWIDEDGGVTDPCSHGSLELVIGGVRLADGSEDYGISEAALALLYTLDRDSSAEAPVAERMIPCGCGMIIMVGCGRGIDWSVTHEPGHVLLDDVVVYPNMDRSEYHPEASVRVPLPRYREQVMAFAGDVRAFFRDAPQKDLHDEFIPGGYAWFWSEFDAIFARHAQVVHGGANDR